MRLWRKAKALGTWDPEDIDLSADSRAWQNLSEAQREGLLQLCVLFHAGERAVTLDLLPLLHVIDSEGRIEEVLYLTSFLWEEAKHVEVFSRFFSEVTGDPGDLSRFDVPTFRLLVEDELHDVMTRLFVDGSPVAQVRASVTYNIVIEGVMADAGYYLFRRILTSTAPMPGLSRAMALLHRDESRHVAFGVYLLSRLISENGDLAYKAFVNRMSELKPLVESSTEELVGSPIGAARFGADVPELVRFSQQRFAARTRRIVRARTRAPDGAGSPGVLPRGPHRVAMGA